MIIDERIDSRDIVIKDAKKKLKVKVSSSFRRICYVLNYKYGLKLTMLGRRNVIIDFEQTDFVTTQTF